jgi:transposase-like protein
MYMVLLSVKCPYCGSTKVVKFGKQPKEHKGMLVAMKNVHVQYFNLTTNTTHAHQASSFAFWK